MGSVWVGYVRVSHVGGRGGESFRSPEDQEASIRGWAQARGDEVVVLPAELDASGGDRDRPVLAEAVAGIERGDFCGLVVAYLSRASRSVSHLLELWDRVEAAGGQVIAVAENIDTSTPAGRLTRTMLAAIAEHELDLHRDRFEDLRASATARGIWQRRTCPVGYERDPETRRLVPGAAAPLVRQAFKMAAGDATVVSIADLLGFTTSGARHVLSNRVYLGELRVGSYVNEAAHPPLVTVDEFLAAQRPVRVKRPPRSDLEPMLLAGITRCASCGHVMTRAWISGRGKRKRYLAYICRGRFSAGRCPQSSAIMAHLVDELVEPLALAEMASVSARAAGPGVDLEAARAGLLAAERELAEFVGAVSAADVGREAFAAGARVRREAIDEASLQLSGLLGAGAGAVSGGLVERWPDLSIEHRNQVLRGLLECVVVRPGRLPVGDRVRAVLAGSGVLPAYRGGSDPLPITELAFPAVGDPRVLGVKLGEDL